MRRSALAPPTHAAIPHRGVLGAPSRAFPRLRRMFDPRSGWFRALERGASHYLSLHVYPWVPGIHYAYGLQLERFLTVSDAEIGMDGLAPGFEGARILLISDIHTGPFLSRRALQRAFDRLSTLEPDLILLGGDFTTCQISEIVPSLPAFRSLNAPLGVYAVLGNHDHYTGDPARLRELLESSGVRVLHNSGVVLERGGGRLALAGIDDLYQGSPDLDAALEAVRGTGALETASYPFSGASALAAPPKTVLLLPPGEEAAHATAPAPAAAVRADAEEMESLYATIGVGAAAGLRAAAAGGASSSGWTVGPAAALPAGNRGGRGIASRGGPAGAAEAPPAHAGGWPPGMAAATAEAAASGVRAGAGGSLHDGHAPFLSELRAHVVAGPQVERMPVVLLSHNPDILFEAARHSVDLVLAGHTHGGQIRIPGLPVLVRQSRYRLDEGRYTSRTTELLVSRGLGVSGIPLRMACSPEAVLIRLRGR